jgi:hypothetical protein
VSVLVSVYAQDEWNSFVQTNHIDSLNDSQQQYKSASRAMLLSAAFPGAGQFYVNKRSITAYLFPVIEIGLWSLFANYRKKGDDGTTSFERYADEHYCIERQFRVQWHLIEFLEGQGYTVERNRATIYNMGNINRPPDGWDWQNIESVAPGNGSHFRLCKSDRQHYYEDLGKYDKYIFGWSDWYGHNVSGTGNNIHVPWKTNGQTLPMDIRIDGTDANPEGFDSELRTHYVSLRHKANGYYANARTTSFFILLNHGLAAVDANLAARRHNDSQQLRSASLTPVIRTTFFDNAPMPFVGLNLSF